MIARHDLHQVDSRHTGLDGIGQPPEMVGGGRGGGLLPCLQPHAVIDRPVCDQAGHQSRRNKEKHRQEADKDGDPSANRSRTEPDTP